MIKNIGTKPLFEAIEAIKKGEISFAKLNNFVVRKDNDSVIRMHYESKTSTEVPLEQEFACFLETFEKSDLKTGMIVRIRGDYKYLVLDNRLLNDTENYDLKWYNDDLTHSDIANKKMDIVKVYDVNKDSVEGLDDYFDASNLKTIASINVIKD